MKTEVHTPLDAGKVAAARTWINTRFSDQGEFTRELMRKVAHDALDKLLVGNDFAANIGIQRLGPEGARDMRAKLRELGIPLEVAA